MASRCGVRPISPLTKRWCLQYCALVFPSLMLMLAIIAIFYFVGIRPQKKQADKQRRLQGDLKRGDRVFTNSGILGKIHQVEENIITLEVAKNTNIKILKNQISGLQTDDSE